MRVLPCFQVLPGDVLLAGSDGLWDNCYDAELLQLLPEHAEGAQQVCARLQHPLQDICVRYYALALHVRRQVSHAYDMWECTLTLVWLH